MLLSLITVGCPLAAAGWLTGYLLAGCLLTGSRHVKYSRTSKTAGGQKQVSHRRVCIASFEIVRR